VPPRAHLLKGVYFQRRHAKSGRLAKVDGHTLRAVIVDDEELARGFLRELLRAHPEIEIVAECANGF